ncbi:unnamed protein product [Spirodela intermedia]|uniref:Uncharacterized protein n=2 Tax=Spirodela intermedia TaxID=51605 RepID=A0ABN7EA96_SPIIN|nr:unnamed protein product [Spirodela intermedia]CAA7395914.1 unnamed protein product [Spirodela intermedia]
MMQVKYLNLSPFYVLSLLENTLSPPLVDSRVEDFKFVDSEVGFFSKIGAL